MIGNTTKILNNEKKRIGTRGKVGHIQNNEKKSRSLTDEIDRGNNLKWLEKGNENEGKMENVLKTKKTKADRWQEMDKEEKTRKGSKN